MFLLSCVIPFTVQWRASLYAVTSCLTEWSHVPSRSVLGGGGSLARGGVDFCLGLVSVQWSLCREGILGPGGSLSKGVSVNETPPPPGMVTSGRYASYWNVFLLFI